MNNPVLESFWDFGFVPDGSPCPPAGGWKYTCRLPVPGCFDTEPEFFLRRGIGCYRTRVTAGGPVILALAGLGPKGEVWWDDRKIGECVLPFSMEEFRFNAGNDGVHELRIQLDNRPDTEPSSQFQDEYDFYRHGGIYRPVTLRPAPPWEIGVLKVVPQDLEHGIAEVTAELSGTFPEETEITLTFDTGATMVKKITGGRSTWQLEVPECRLWTPESPQLHTLTAASGGQRRTVTFGMRTVSIGGGRILLNGKPVKLLGYNRHDSHPDFGYAVPETLVHRDLARIKAQGCNFIRGCHYPQSEAVLNWCDRLGLLVWEETLAWGNQEKSLADPVFRSRQLEQVRRLAAKSINHPCVILQGFLNECRSDLPTGRSLIQELTSELRRADGSRLITYAGNLPESDISLTETDVLSFNVYPGWYLNPNMNDGQQLDAAELEKALHQYETIANRPEYRNKPLILSEIGSAALPGCRGDMRWSEEYQAELAVTVFRYVLENPRCSGVALWQYCDTRSYNDYQAPARPRGFNNKGLLDEYRRPKLAWQAVTGLLRSRTTAAEDERKPGGK